MKQFQYVRPSSQLSVLAAISKPGTRIIAGGTNLVDLMKRGVTAPDKLVDINYLPLKEISTIKGGGIYLGALALNSAVAGDAGVMQFQPLLSMALNAGASPQLRNMATVGGNMMQRTRCTYFYDTVMPCNKREPGTGCGAMEGYNRMHAIFGTSEKCIAVHPSDMCVALAALDATIVIAGKKGQRRLPFVDFHRLPGEHPEMDNHLAYGEMILSVEIPANNFAKNSYYLKVRDRQSYAFALVSVAAALDIQGGIIKETRLAMGGVAHKPWRLFDAEKYLTGKAATIENFEQAAQIATQGAKAHEHNAFKLKLAPATITEALKTRIGINLIMMKEATILVIPSSADGMSRIDGRAKVTGAARYAAEYKLDGMTYAVLVGSTITKGTIANIDTRAAGKAPGVLAVVTYLNSPKVPGYQTAKEPGKAPTKGGPLKIFYDNKVLFNGQPVAMVIADSFERAQYGASLIKTQYIKEPHETALPANKSKGTAPRGQKDFVRGTVDAYQSAPFKLEQEYTLPTEVHNPMELHAIIARWDADDKLTVWDKTQGVKGTQQSIAQAFKLPKENVQVNSQFVGGAFGAALRTWPHEIAAVIGAKMVKRPLKLVLSRPDMFTSVGYRPYTLQKIGIGATADGKLVGITHEAYGQTSTYEDFTEGPVSVSQSLYACPNVTTRYKLVSLDVNTPTWMRGPGEATGAFALESALDELSYALKIDPIDLRMRNYAKTDPESGKPFSSKYLDEAYEMGAKQINWKNRNQQPGAVNEDGWLAGYGMGGGMFGAYRGSATVKAIMLADGTLHLQTAVSDIGPGTGTAMVLIAAEQMGIPASNIKFEMGDSSLPPSPTQGGSAVTSTVGSAVYDACKDLKQKFQKLMGNGGTDNPDYVKILKDHSLSSLEVTVQSSGGSDMQKYAMQSWSVHFVKVLVHPTTGVVKVDKVVCVADSGHIVSAKTARSQVVGGAIGGIGMALMEEGIIDHRYGRYVNNNFADYHVPVNADIPQIDALFVNKPDPYINPMGAKGMGEIALIGMAAAVANAVYNATGKRIRSLPITPDKLI